MTARNPALRASTPMPVGFSGVTPPQWTAFLDRYPDQLARSAARVTLTRQYLQELILVKSQVGANCPYRRDKAGRDVWSILKDGQSGDCEDLVLTIRARLKALGWPLGALRPAICKTHNGTGHMVLCIVTKAAGVYVADNRLSHIAPWAKLSYDWLLRLDGERWRMVNPLHK